MQKSVVIRFFPYAVTVGTVGILGCGSALFIEYTGYAVADVVGIGKRTESEMLCLKWTGLDDNQPRPTKYILNEPKYTSSWQKVRPW